MAENSKIEWTDHTFNPWIGCQKVGPGCQQCYAERDFTRKPRWADAWGPPETSNRYRTSEAYWKKPFSWQRKAEAAGVPARVFCASLADVFEDNPQVGTWRIELFEDLVSNTPWLHWQILTKRPGRAVEFFANRPELLTGNIWFGTSAEDQESANRRISEAFKVSALLHFVSVEPMLGPITVKPYLLGPPTCTRCKLRLPERPHPMQPCPSCGGLGYVFHRNLHWVIVGCESGPNRRPMELEWAIDLVRQCQAAGVACFVKQIPVNGKVSKDPSEWPEELRVREYPR